MYIREAAKKVLFFSGPATKGLYPPPHPPGLVAIRNFFFQRLQIKKKSCKKFLFPQWLPPPPLSGRTAGPQKKNFFAASLVDIYD